MRTFCCLHIVLLLTGTLVAQQGKLVIIPKVMPIDSQTFFRMKRERESSLQLMDLTKSPDSFHFRFYQFGHVADIWTDDFKTFHGQLTNYAYKEGKRNSNDRKVLFNKVSIDSSLARQAFSLTRAIDDLPSGEAIKGWDEDSTGQRFDVSDGYTFSIETSSPRVYQFRTYGNPASQSRTIKEGKKVMKFVDSLESLISFSKSYSDFQGKLKPGSYTNGSVTHFIILKKRARKLSKGMLRGKK